MSVNTIQTAAVIQSELDKAAVEQATSGWMEVNSNLVKYNGGSEVKIPELSMDGLADYDRQNGFVAGGVNFKYQTKTMTQDRGRSFSFDENAVDETNFALTAATVMGEFQRPKVIPEIDAYRISKIASETITADKSGMIEYGYTPGAASTSALRKLKEGIKAIRNLYNGPLVCHATPDFIMELELELAGKITAVTFARGGINTSVPAVDGVPIVSTPSNRMYTAITLYDGKTSSQEAGGYVKGSKAKDINFFICPRTTPIAVTKQDVMRIFDPNINQSLNAWQLDYRRFHDQWVLDNKLDSIFLNIKETKE